MYRGSAPLLEGAGEYRWLLDRGYPENASLKLVGDRHALSGEERLILFRGVADAEASRRRRGLIVGSARGRRLIVDGHNQAFTVMHYLAGRPLFLGSDGLLRDAGGSHGHIADRALFRRALLILAEALVEERPETVLACFDEPITGSAGQARFFRDCLVGQGLAATTLLERSADGALRRAEPGELVATGDSGIVEALARARPEEAPTGGPAVFDAARRALERAFGLPGEAMPWLDLASLLDGPA
ncbi:MAG TPA: DUF434 domain-containing protein [Rectinemataceae bacterium]|nr:DUF434 domain-containing protein [Rectinemataceae bacterium]